jgi:serine protease Do
MRRRGFIIGAVFLGILATVHGQGDDKNAHLQQALALEKTVQKVIQTNEASIASIIVSRSEHYARFGQGSPPDQPGKLGTFDREAIQTHPLFKEQSAASKKTLLRKLDLTDETSVPESCGSGVVVDNKGLILTPYHVVLGATKILVRLPGNKMSYADIFAADPRSDLAVLRLLDAKLAPQAIRFGDGGKVERGQFVVGLCFTFTPGMRHSKPSAAWGVIANLRVKADERGKTLYDYSLLIQTDARVHPGCSGAVLFNLQGEAIGITSSLAGVGGTDVAGAYALPLDAGLQRVLAVLKKGQEVEYGFLGVSFEPPTKGEEGVKLAYVTEGSPAEESGLKMGHVILAVNGTPVSDRDDVLRLLSTQLAGAKVTLQVHKKSELVVANLAKYYVGGKSIATDTSNRPFFRGLRVDYSSLVVQQPNSTINEIPRGVLITDVEPDSAAAKANLQIGTIITHVNGVRVGSPAEFYAEVLNSNSPVELTLPSAEQGQPPRKVTLP